MFSDSTLHAGNGNHYPAGPVAPIPARRQRKRHRRSTFYPSAHAGGAYRLPQRITEELWARLQGHMRPQNVYAFAVFVARQHSGPRLVEGFFLCRDDLAGAGGLLAAGGICKDDGQPFGEKAVRNAIATLEEIGFIVRDAPAGNGWRKTDAGPRKAAIRFRFGPDFVPLFLQAKAANRRQRGAIIRGPRDRTLKGSSLNRGPLRAKFEKRQTQPLAAKGFSIGRVPVLAEPDPEKAAALAYLDQLRSSAEPLPMLSTTLKASLLGGRR